LAGTHIQFWYHQALVQITSCTHLLQAYIASVSSSQYTSLFSQLGQEYQSLVLQVNSQLLVPFQEVVYVEFAGLLVQAVLVVAQFSE
jgi:hypothetical protein